MNNKEKIFQVSIDLFSKYGYDGVSVRQIAREVGIKSWNKGKLNLQSLFK